MKLISCHIDAFGKLKNVDLKFDEHLNSICEENGFGKTTLAMFIKAMFYGLGANARKNSKLTDRTQYQPFGMQGGYGGSIVFSCDKGKFIVRRVFNRTSTLDEFYLFDAENNMPSKAFSSDIGQELFNVGKDTFDATIFFGQKHLESEVNDDIRATLSTGELSGDDLDSLTKAIDKIKVKRKDIKAQLKTIDLEKENRELNTLYLQENEYNKKIKKCESDLALYDERILYYKNEQKNLDDKKDEFEELDKQKSVLELYINDKEKEKNNLKSIKNEEKSQKNNKKLKINNIFLILSIIFVVFSLISLGVYFALNSVFLIAGFAVLFVVGVLFIILHIMRLRRFKQKLDIEEDNQNLKFEELKKIDMQINEKSKQLKEINFKIENLLGGNVNAFVANYEKIAKCIESYGNEKVKAKNDIKHYQEEVSLLQTKIMELDDKIQEDKENYELFSNNLKILDKTEEFLTNSGNNLSKRYVEPVQRKFDEFYSKFFVKDQIVVNSDLNMLLKNNYLEEGYLSAGLQDLVQICKRFALIDLIYKKEKPFIILDDPFINLDDKNLKIAQEILNEISKNYQIIFLTCHSSRKL